MSTFGIFCGGYSAIQTLELQPRRTQNEAVQTYKDALATDFGACACAPTAYYCFKVPCPPWLLLAFPMSEALAGISYSYFLQPCSYFAKSDGLFLGRVLPDPPLFAVVKNHGHLSAS